MNFGSYRISMLKIQNPKSKIFLDYSKKQCDQTKSNEVCHYVKPASGKKLPRRADLGIKVREGHAGGGTEPYHGASEAYRIGQQGPVITSLLEAEFGERDVIKNRGKNSQKEC